MERSLRARVLIADDHVLVAEACKKLLEPEFEVVGIVPDGRALVQRACEMKPDVVVADIAMPLLNGLDAGQQIKKAAPALEVIFLTMNPDPDLCAEAFNVGARGYVLKTSSASELRIAVREVLKGKSYVSPSIRKDMAGLSRRRDGTRVREHLTDRQREVLQLLAEGRSMKEVANLLCITPRTVAFHKYRIMEILKVKSTAELVQHAIKDRLLAA